MEPVAKGIGSWPIARGAGAPDLGPSGVELSTVYKERKREPSGAQPQHPYVEGQTSLYPVREDVEEESPPRRSAFAGRAL